MFAFPGGVVEDQDQHNLWSEYAKEYDSIREDLTFRICALRETFEETSFLPFSRKDKSIGYLDTFDKQEFQSFCKSQNFFPAVNDLYAFKKLSPPDGAPPP